MFRYTVETYCLTANGHWIQGARYRTRQDPQTFLHKRIIDGRKYELTDDGGEWFAYQHRKPNGDLSILEFHPYSR